MMNHKSLREKERRDEINKKINELRNFVCEDENERRTLKQADVLTRTVELVYRMESETPGPSYIPERKGFVDGFAIVENEVYSFIKRLGVDYTVCQTFINEAKKCFDRERSSLLLKHNKSPKSLAQCLSSRSSESVRSTPSPHVIQDRKEIKKNREQDRRDRQGEAIEALKNFLISINGNKLTTRLQVEKMQRLNTLENIIEYIRNKKNNFGTRSTRDQAMYQHAFDGGFEIAKRTALSFFRRDKHLCVRAAALEQHLELSRVTPTPIILRQNPINTGLLPLPILPNFNPLPFLPMLQLQQINKPLPFIYRAPSPSYSLGSSPPFSDSSASSADSTPSIPKQKSNLKRALVESSCNNVPAKFWRPWE